MSGRGRSNYRQGRGHGRSKGRGNSNYRSGNNRNNNHKKTPQKETKFAPIGDDTKEKHYAPYATVLEAITTHVQKNYKGGADMAKSLKDGKMMDLSSEKPVRLRSQAKEEADRVFEQAGFDIAFTEEHKLWIARKEQLKDNGPKCYALITSTYCTKAMLSRLEAHPDFDSFRDNPYATLDAIKELMHSPVRAQYPLATLDKAEKRLYRCKQKDGENINDYYKRFNQARDVLESHIGTRSLDYYVENLPVYQATTDAAEQEAMKKNAWECRMAYTFLINSDQSKYGSRVSELRTQYSLTNDQYPKTVKKVLDALSNHPFDAAYKNRQRRQNPKNDTERTDRSRSRPPQNDDDDGSTATSFAQRPADWRCYCCGKRDCEPRTCPKRDSTPPDQWYVRRALQNHQDADESEYEDDYSSDDESTSSRTRRSGTRGRSQTPRPNNRTNWSGNQRHARRHNSRRDEFEGFTCGLNPSPTIDTKSDTTMEVSNKQTGGKFDHLKTELMLDNGSTIEATICNSDMAEDIKVTNRPLLMTTNAGSKDVNLECNIPGFGKGYFDANFQANIFGFSHMADKYRIVYDNKYSDSFTVFTDDGPVVFTRKNRLYTYKPSDSYFNDIAEHKNMVPPDYDGATELQEAKSAYQLDDTGPEPSPTCTTIVEHSNMVNTVAENLRGFTKKEIERAREARKLYHRMGCPSIRNMKLALRQKLIQNCPVTVDDVNIAEQIYGGDIGTLKGKNTRRKPTKVRDDYIEIPPELTMHLDNLTFYLDVMYINGLPMLTGIYSRIRYRCLVNLKSRTGPELYRALDEVFRVYNGAGYYLTKFECDNEFQPLLEQVCDTLEVDMECPPAGAHVPEAERNNRTIGERYRVAYHNLPYAMIPTVMIRYLALVITEQITYFPAKGGISSHYSPYVILNRRELDYNRNFQVPFGAYVQANQDNTPTNTNAPRTIDAIYLRPKPRGRGHEVMNLKTGRVITRDRVYEKPVTPLVIKAVESLATEQGIQSLKIVGRNKVPLFPADWIAGVDYEGEDPYENEDETPQPDTEYTYDDNSDDEYDSDDDLDDDELYDRVDPDETEHLRAEPTDNQANPADMEQPEPEQPIAEPEQPAEIEQQPDQPEEVTDDDTTASEVRRSSRTTTAPERLTYERLNHNQGPIKARTNKHIKGKAKLKVRFEDQARRLLETCHNLIAQVSPNPDLDREYTPQVAMIMARVIADINARATAEGASFGQQYILQKGLKKFGDRGMQGTMKELDQLHRRTCFSPIDISKLTPEEKRKAQEALMFLTEKRDKSIKGRLVYNGKPTREWLSKEDAASPTVSLESIFLCAIIDAKEGRDVLSADIPNAFIQTLMPEVKDGEERVIMKITGVLVDLLVEIAPEVYGPFVVFENGHKVLYVQVIRALYGMLVAALLWYRQFKGDLESIGFKFNPYDPCVANRIVKGNQQTIRFHVDDLMSSHIDKRVNDKFLIWLNDKYGHHGEVKATRGDVHDYLGMTFDWSDPGKVKVDMIDYMTNMVEEFPDKLQPSDTAPTPAAENLFAEGTGPSLDAARAKEFHTFVAKALFACKRARPDIHTATIAMTTRVNNPKEDDWKRLTRMMRYINGTLKDKMILSADDLHVLKWHVDSAFAVHPDFKSHTGGGLTFGVGTPITQSRKQKLNTRSSTEAELVATDDMSTMILWTKLFMEAQGYTIRKNILYQDNKSTILLVNNGKKSSGKRTRAINIRYFFLTDQVEKGNVTVEYMPTTDMIGDFFSKPLQGKLFEKFRKQIMGH